MAMMDYGAVVKKNGKIISDHKGGLFQNFSNLKHKCDDEGDTTIDETIVQGKDWDGNPTTFSMAGNYFALVGDEHFLIGFYKLGFNIAIDKKVVDNIPATWDWFEEHVKPLKFTINNEIDVVISLVQKENIDYSCRMNVYLAKFTYKCDNYEVLFGYGIDPSLLFTFTDRNYYHHKRKDYWHKIGNHYIRTGRWKYRKGLKFIRKWTWDGLTEEQRLIIPKKYRLK